MTAIEHYMVLRAEWISAAELTRVFSVQERELRSTRGEPGLCSSFAISGNRGFKHVRHATEEEWTTFEERLRSHGLSELTRVAQLRENRDKHLAAQAADLEAKRTFDGSGQGLLLG